MLLVFDLDDTLIPTTEEFTPRRLERALRKMIGSGLSVGYEEGKRLLLEINARSYRSQEALAEFVNRVGGGEELRNLGWSTLEEGLEEIEIRKESWVNDFLRGLNYRKAIVTAGNTNVQQQKIDRFGIERELFEEIIVADRKEVAYRALKEKFGPFVVIGDRIQNDLSSAKQIGGITVHIRQGRGRLEPKNHPDVDHEIEKITDLKGILEKI